MKNCALILILIVLFSCKENKSKSYHIEEDNLTENTGFSKDFQKKFCVIDADIFRGEDEYFSIKKQNYFITDSLVIDTLRTIQILEGNMFVDKIDMDYYVYRIGKTTAQNDTIISFSLDKEGNYIDIIERKIIKWVDFYSIPPKNITIKRKKNSIIWELFYDDILIYKFIEEKDIEKSGYPILFYKQPL